MRTQSSNRCRRGPPRHQTYLQGQQSHLGGGSHQGWGKSGDHSPLQFMHPERPLRTLGHRGPRDLGVSS